LGGAALAFPHHEDEIAQSEGAGVQTAGLRFVKYWMHGAHLLVEGRKMSKSLGNFFTLRDLLSRGFRGREVRALLLGAHYRETFNFTLEGLEGSRSALARIDECVDRLHERAAGAAPGSEPPAASTLRRDFTGALDDDLNVSRAWAAVFEWVRETNRVLAAGELDAARAAAALAAWAAVDGVLGLGRRPAEEAPPEVLALLEKRTAAKKARNFAEADDARAGLKALGWVVEDTPKGPRLKRA
ncbi:MAG: DALR domain-containing protein, partial [Verrucomicrobiota bacterium]